ncbi:MAG: hypothetical protein ABWY54_05865 [Glaciihabitans sp.]
MNRRRIALGVAGLGAVLVCASGAYFGISASALLAPAGMPTADPVSRADEEVASNYPVTVNQPAVDLPPETVASIDEQLASIPRDWPAAEVEHATIWLQQQEIIADCMDDAGFTYTYQAYWSLEPGSLRSPSNASLSAAEREREQFALWGATGGGPDYHWEDAGCHGYAVHVTGQDNAH